LRRPFLFPVYAGIVNLTRGPKSRFGCLSAHDPSAENPIPRPRRFLFLRNVHYGPHATTLWRPAIYIFTLSSALASSLPYFPVLFFFFLTFHYIFSPLLLPGSVHRQDSSVSVSSFPSTTIDDTPLHLTVLFYTTHSGAFLLHAACLGAIGPIARGDLGRRKGELYHIISHPFSLSYRTTIYSRRPSRIKSIPPHSPIRTRRLLYLLVLLYFDFPVHS
jgi:hypothetical protein